MNLQKELMLIEIAEKYWEAELNNDIESMKKYKNLMDEKMGEIK